LFCLPFATFNKSSEGEFLAKNSCFGKGKRSMWVVMDVWRMQHFGCAGVIEFDRTGSLLYHV